MENSISGKSAQQPCVCGSPQLFGFLHRMQESCILITEKAVSPDPFRDLHGGQRFYAEHDGLGCFEVLGTASASGSRAGRDNMVVYVDVDAQKLRYTSEPDFTSRFLPTDRFDDAVLTTPLRVTRWEKRVKADSEATSTQAVQRAMLLEIADYRRVAAQHCDPLRRYFRAYHPAPLDTTRLTRYGPNEWAAGADDEFGPRDEGEYVKLADVHTLAAQVKSVTPDAMLSLLHYAANQLERLGHVEEANELDRRIVAATSIPRQKGDGV